MPPFLDGRIPPEVIDRAVARVLRAKFELGLFERPVRRHRRRCTSVPGRDGDPRRAAAPRSCAARRAGIDRPAQERGATLPLSPTVGSIAVRGPRRRRGPPRRLQRPGDGRRSASSRASAAGSAEIASGTPRAATCVEPALRHRPRRRLSSCGVATAGPGTARRVLRQHRRSPANPSSPAIDPHSNSNGRSSLPTRSASRTTSIPSGGPAGSRSPVTGSVRIGIEGNDGYRLYLDDALVIDNWRKATLPHACWSTSTFSEGPDVRPAARVLRTGGQCAAAPRVGRRRAADAATRGWPRPSNSPREATPRSSWRASRRASSGTGRASPCRDGRRN